MALLKLESVAKRVNAALAEYGILAASAKGANGQYSIGEYQVDTNLMTCSCKDHKFRSSESPCKHLIVAFIYEYGEKHQDASPFDS